MRKVSLWRTVWLVCMFYAVEAIVSPAQTFKTLVSFDSTNGANPVAELVQGVDGNFYGTTFRGGANVTGCGSYGCGTVFKVTPAGALTSMHSFARTDGAGPQGGLVLATNGNFYGTTFRGGSDKHGTVYKITSQGSLTTLVSLNYGHGSRGALVQATDGNFYGEGESVFNGGTVYKITATGKLTRLYKFCPQPCTEGSDPDGGLVQATNGNLYGVTVYGGANGYGTVFKITPAGSLTSLHSFNITDGAFPDGALVQATDGNFYGVTQQGGSRNNCSFGYGTVFKITPAGKLTTIYSFCAQINCTDGAGPNGLIQAADGNFYGTAIADGGGAYCNNSMPCGTVFRITTAGKLTTLYSFCSQPNCIDGALPGAQLVQATDGNFYGTTTSGGSSNNCYGGSCGTVFSLSVGLGPFVETNPVSGKVGRAVTILGNNLKGTSSVTFNGTAATFTVVRSTEIKTTVPSGATTGFVTVTTPKGTLKGNVAFRVTK